MSLHGFDLSKAKQLFFERSIFDDMLNEKTVGLVAQARSGRGILYFLGY